LRPKSKYCVFIHGTENQSLDRGFGQATIFRCTYCCGTRSVLFLEPLTVYREVGRVASEEVVVQLLKAECLSVLYYGLDSCPINKERANSLDHTVNSCIRKIFSTKDEVVIQHCMLYFAWPSVLEVVKKRKRKVHAKIRGVKNNLCGQIRHCVK